MILYLHNALDESIQWRSVVIFGHSLMSLRAMNSLINEQMPYKRDREVFCLEELAKEVIFGMETPNMSTDHPITLTSLVYWCIRKTFSKKKKKLFHDRL